MNNISNIEKLALSGKFVFNTADLAVLWQIHDRRRLLELIKYYVSKKRLTGIHKGVYAYTDKFTFFDIAQKLVPLSYLSLFTTSALHGLTFQYHDSIYCMSLRNRKIIASKKEYIYRQIKQSVFFHQVGLVHNGRYCYADIERTICDCLYLYPHFAFDNFPNINTDKLTVLSKIYQNQRLERDIAKIVKIIKS